MRFLLVILAGIGLLANPVWAQQVAGELPIHQVAREGSGEEVSRLLKSDPSQRDVRSALGSTPLHLAAMNPDRSAMAALLKAGADPNARDADGSTPIHMAAYASRAEHARQLLAAGADPLLKNNQGRDATSMARKVKADEAAGVISLWILKACSVAKPC